MTYTVKGVIEALEHCNPDAKVYVTSNNNFKKQSNVSNILEISYSTSNEAAVYINLEENKNNVSDKFYD